MMPLRRDVNADGDNRYDDCDGGVWDLVDGGENYDGSG